MIEDGRGCESIVMQLAAIRSAIEGVGALVMNNYMKLCFHRDDEADSTSVNSLARSIAIRGENACR
jgi:DNA-binding FrmR family transcriptional regulator